MTFKEYCQPILSNFTDYRILQKINELFSKIVALKTIKLWELCKNKSEYEKMKHLFDGSLKSILDDKMICKALHENLPQKIIKEDYVYCLHDVSSIRKPYSQKSENLGKVLDLNGKVINGYETFDTVIVNNKGKDLNLLNTYNYSNRQPEFLSKEKLKEYNNLNSQNKVPDTARNKEIKELLSDESYINLEKLSFSQLKTSHDVLKNKNPEIKMCHVLDRGFDGNSYFNFIDEVLEDDFVIRLKLSRNSNKTEINSKTNRKNFIKLSNLEFSGKYKEVMGKIRFKKKIYSQANILIEWDKLIIENKNYNIVRITIYDRNGKSIFKNPMLLITNIEVKNSEIAKDIYHIYRMRSKIEEVFKFLKTVLGWEKIQVRDWESIKNILSLCYFIGGYFYSIESELTKNIHIEKICFLGNGKGKISRTYFLRGLEKLLINQEVEDFKKKNSITEDDFKEMLKFITFD